MYEAEVYHGTDSESAESILSNGMNPSRGDKHWLGDGCYFYEEDFHAYKWIWYLKNNNNRKRNVPYIRKGDILKHFSIIKATISSQKSRVFNLDHALPKLAFERAYKWINSQIAENQELRKRLNEEGVCAEGVVLNYMFESLGYDEKYDVVKALFPYKLKRHFEIEERLEDAEKPIKDKTYRLAFVPEIQICVRNNEVIKNLENHDCSKDLKDYDDIISNVYYFETLD